MVHDIPVSGGQVLLDDEAAVERGMPLAAAAAATAAPTALRCIDDGDAARAGPISGYCKDTKIQLQMQYRYRYRDTKIQMKNIKKRYKDTDTVSGRH